MDLQINPTRDNAVEPGGFLIKSPSVKVWMQELQLLSFKLEEISLYPVPGSKANSVWGCLVITGESLAGDRAGRHERCQEVSPRFFIPEKAGISPVILPQEREKLFSANVHLFHPEVGVADLGEPLQMEELMAAMPEIGMPWRIPEPSTFIPRDISLYEVKIDEGTNVMARLEKAVGKKSDSKSDKELTLLEKLRLQSYRLLFSKEKSSRSDSPVKKSRLMERLESLWGSDKEDSWEKELEADYRDLEERNQQELEKLLDMLKKNPAEGLKYAVPLDQGGTSRGQADGSFVLSKLWEKLSIFAPSPPQGGGAATSEDQFSRLRAQYYQTARQLVEEEEYEKAAFVYLKLLKSPSEAATTLEKGQLFAEAAFLYHSELNNLAKAAECYEKGNMIRKAIPLYEEIDHFEKAGDLYVQIQEKANAMNAFGKAAQAHLFQENYEKASVIYRLKMDKPDLAQLTLLGGWNNKQATLCLQNYFIYSGEDTQLKNAISTVHQKHVNKFNKKTFLNVLHKERLRRPQNEEFIREMTYEVVAQYAAQDRSIVDELKKFHPSNRDLSRDTNRFRRK